MCVKRVLKIVIKEWGDERHYVLNLGLVVLLRVCCCVFNLPMSKLKVNGLEVIIKSKGEESQW